MKNLFSALLTLLITYQSFAISLHEPLSLSFSGFIAPDSVKQQPLFRPAAFQPVKSSPGFKLQSILPYAAPAFMMGYGFMSLKDEAIVKLDNHLNDEITKNHKAFSSGFEDKLQYAPVAAVYALNMAGMQSRNNFLDRTAIYLLSNTLTSFAVSFVKDNTHKLRPSGFDYRSFPSGHTAIAFAGAEFMRQEYQYSSPWPGYAGYAMATATGALRILHNKHWLSDVVAGAGIGILSTKLSYAVYPWLKQKIFGTKSYGFTVMPVYQPRNIGFSLVAPL